MVNPKMSKPPVLFLYTSTSCSACERFMSTWPDMQAKIKKENLVGEIVHRKQATLSPSDWDDSVPTAFKEKVSYFPSLFLVRAADWAAGAKNKSAAVTSILYNAKEKVDVLEWIRKNAASSTLTSTQLTSAPAAAPPKAAATAPPPAAPRLPTLMGNNPNVVCSHAYRVRERR